MKAVKQGVVVQGSFMGRFCGGLSWVSLGLRGLGRGCAMVRMPAGKALMVLSAVLEGEGGARGEGGMVTRSVGAMVEDI